MASFVSNSIGNNTIPDPLALGNAPTNATSSKGADPNEMIALLTKQQNYVDRLVRTELLPDGRIRVYKRGEFRMSNGDLYVGEVVDDVRHGRGTYYYSKDDVYVGEFADGVFDGFGVLKKAPFRDGGRDCVGRSFNGQWKQGLRDGRGKYHTGFGDYYDGEFKSDLYHAMGMMLYANGDKYEGDWVRGLPEVKGTMVYAKGNSYIGSWYRGLYHGEGLLRYGQRGGTYNGSWKAGLKHGIGKRSYASGAEYEGKYIYIYIYMCLYKYICMHDICVNIVCGYLRSE